MNKRRIAIVIPYTKDKKILLQERKSISKWGEEWSFWGGGVENGESMEQAAKREIKEELDFTVKNLEYVGSGKRILTRIKPPHEKWEITYEVFATEVKDDLSQFTVHEGESACFFTISEVRKLTMAPIIDSETLDLLENFFDRKEE